MTDAATPNLKAFTRGKDEGISVPYMGSALTFLVNSYETGGSFAMLEAEAALGNEPPPHVHFHEHEIFEVVEGEMEFFCEGEPESLAVHAGGLIFIPQGRAHAMYILSPKVHIRFMGVRAGSQATEFDGFFHDVTATTGENASTHVQADPARAAAAAAAHGTLILAPDEVARRLPHYPGFGANLRTDNPA